MKNIHITLTEFRNESRLIKEITSLGNASLFDEFIVIALGAGDLAKTEQRADNFTVKRLNLFTRRFPKNAPFQLIKYIEFILRCLLILSVQKANVVNVHTLALLPLGALSKFFFKNMLVYDAHELETEKNGLHGFRQKTSKWIERIFIKYCDLVIVVGEEIANWYAKNYHIELPLVVKNSPFLKSRVKKDFFRQQLNIRSNQKILLYQGGLMHGRGVHLILEAFEQRSTDSIVAVFMGYGEFETKIREAQDFNENVFYFPAVSPDVVLDYTASADIGIHMIQNTCLNHYYCMPNKFFEYSMAGLPIIISNMKEMADAVREYGFGSVINEPTPDSINKAIDCLLSQNLDVMSCASYQFASDNAWEVQQDVMLKGYRRMIDI